MDTFIEFGIILLVASLISVVMSYLKQPLIIGYILSGLLLGPVFLNILQSSDYLDLFSKIGISILLFIVGINLNFSSMKESGKTSLITGVGQVIFTSLIGFFILVALDFDYVTSFYGSVALTFSSTIIILKLLSDKGEVGSLYGKISIGFLLVQDIIATFLLIFVPIIAAYMNEGSSLTELVSSLGVLGIKGVLAISGVYILSRFVFPKFFNFLSKNQELLFLFSIAWGLILSAIFYKLGFSIEIGALIAGVSLSSLKYSTQISSRLRPLRDFFIVLFFILLGAHLELSQISSIFSESVILSLFVLIGNPLIVFILMNLLGHNRKVSFLCGLTVAQISEFSLILMTLGLSLGQVSKEAVSLITMVGIYTIAASTYMIRYSDKLYKFLEPALKRLEILKNKSFKEEKIPKETDTLIFGFGRVGKEFASSLIKGKEGFLIVEYDPIVIKEIEKLKLDYKFGNVEDIELLEDLSLPNLKRIISSIPDFNLSKFLLKYYKNQNQDLVIILVAKTVKEASELYKLGADYVVITYLLGASYAAELVLYHSVDKNIFKKEKEKQLLKHKFNSKFLNS